MDDAEAIDCVLGYSWAASDFYSRVGPYLKLNRGSRSGCISMFSVNLTFDKTLMMHFCCQKYSSWVLNSLLTHS